MSVETGPVSVWTEGVLGRGLIAASQSLANFGIAVPDSPNLFAFLKSLASAIPGTDRSGHLRRGRGDQPPRRLFGGQGGLRSPLISSTAGRSPRSVRSYSRPSPTSPPSFAPPGRVRREPPPEGIPADVFTLILAAEAKLDGWCTREKALFLARTILQERPDICVETGVFGGRSVVPCAAALRHNGAGCIYGIETWNPDVLTENALDEKDDQWWTTVEFPRIKREFYRFVAAADLTQQVCVIEARSARAAALFDQIDFLHIDGAHSVVNAAEDVILYARKVRRGGIVVFDDIERETTEPALKILHALCHPVAMLTDPVGGKENCAVLRRR